MRRNLTSLAMLVVGLALSACSGSKSASGSTGSTTTTTTTGGTSSGGTTGCGPTRAACAHDSDCCSGYCDPVLSLCSLRPTSSSSAGTSGASTASGSTSGTSAGTSSGTTAGTSAGTSSGTTATTATTSGPASSTGASTTTTSAGPTSSGSTGTTTTGGTTTGTTSAGTTGGSTGTTGCTRPCAPGSVRCNASGAVETCQQVSGCYIFVQTGNCGAQTCQNGVCVDPTCGGGCSTPPGALCRDANSRTTYAATGTCNNGACSYAETIEACPYGCQQGVCLPAPSCTPASQRCNGTQVETCNVNGTAWLFTDNCPSTCTNGLCDAPCTPNATRCNSATVETCNPQGTAWVAAPACLQGCIAGACIQSDLTVSGNTVYMEGEYHFSHAVVVQNGGQIVVGDPDGGPSSVGSLTIYAPEIDIEPSSTITANVTAADCSADPDNVANGIRLYATTVRVDGTVSWTGSGCSKDGVVIRADTINGSGTVSSTYRNLLLFGTGGVATGLNASGATKSLMPPANITSPTHPLGGTYNDDAPPPVFSWDKPYSTVAGYYYVVGSTADVVPTQTNTFNSTEALALPSPVDVGDTYLDVITIDTNGTPGTVPHQFKVHVVGEPPALSSPSNPNQGTYTTNTAVTVQYSGGNAARGYYWILDEFPNTRPTSQTGTAIAANHQPQQVFIQPAPTGQHWFHMIAYDSMGYPTKGAEHYEIDIGTAPSTGTLAGTVKDGSNQPIANATVVIQRGLYTTTSDANGVYHFNNSVPAGTYEVVASATGFESQQVSVVVSAGASANQYFTLAAGSGCPTCTDLCSGVACPAPGPYCSSGTAYAPPLWGSTCVAGACSNEFATANQAVTNCSYGCYGTTCAGGQIGDGCNTSSQCSSGYCEPNGTCGSTYCYNGAYYCNGSSYSCCHGLTCAYQGYPTYDYVCQ